MKKYIIGSVLLIMLQSVFSADKPNVLFIVVDDLNNWTGYLDGHPDSKTPNIDALAERSVVFSRSYCPAPACNPCRTAVLTGMSPSTSGVYVNDDEYTDSEVANNAVDLPKHFKDNGYYTVWAGKTYHKKPIQSDLTAMWSDMSLKDGGYGPYPQNGHPIPNASEMGAGALTYEAYEGDEDDFPDVRNYKAFQTFVGDSHDAPWFYALGFYRPHVPWTAPKRFFDMFPPATEISLPDVIEDDLDDLPPMALKWIAEKADHRALADAGWWDDLVRAYLASTAFVDDCIGQTLASLEGSAYADNTIICLWSDHGWDLGHKEHWTKFCLWEQTTNNNLIIYVPGNENNGSVSNKIVNLLDLYPTLNDLCGLTERPGLEGRSLKPLIENPSLSSWENVTVTTQGYKNHAIRDDQWRYIHYSDGTEELYNHENDSNEWYNLAGDAQYNDVKLRLAGYIPTVNVLPVSTDADTVLPKTIYVDLHGSDIDGDGTSDDPYSGIEKAYAVSNDGDSIYIAAGIYTTSNEMYISDKSVYFVGEEANTTIVQASSEKGVATHRLFKSNNTESLIKNMTLRHGNVLTGNGGAIFNMSKIHLENVIIEDNSAKTGGGIYSKGTLMTLKNVIVRNNYSASDIGGGAVFHGIDKTLDVTIENSLFAYNASDTINGVSGGGIAAYGESDTKAGTLNIKVTNTTFAFNRSGNTGGGVLIRKIGSDATVDAQFTNCTFSQNRIPDAKRGAAVYIRNEPNVTLNNCIVANNYSGIALNGLSRHGAAMVSNITGENNIVDVLQQIEFDDNSNQNITSGIPMGFIADRLSEEGGFSRVLTIQYGSIAHNSADPKTSAETDQRGLLRDHTPDIGAYEILDVASNIIPMSHPIENRDIRCYPIVVDEIVTLENRQDDECTVLITNLLGRVVVSSFILRDIKTIDVSHLTQGVYCVCTLNNKNNQSLKFIKK